MSAARARKILETTKISQQTSRLTQGSERGRRGKTHARPRSGPGGWAPHLLAQGPRRGQPQATSAAGEGESPVRSFYAALCATETTLAPGSPTTQGAPGGRSAV